MHEQLLLDHLEQAVHVSETISLKTNELRKVLAYVKSLEINLAQALALAHGKKRRKVAA